MNNNLQRYNGSQDGGIGKLLMIAAFVYTVLPDLIPGPLDDGGVIILALVVVGLLSLFNGSNS